MTKHQSIVDFEKRLNGWIPLVEEAIVKFGSGDDASIHSLSSYLHTLNGVVSRFSTLLPDVDITLRDRLTAIQIKAALLEASGYDLSEELPF